MHSLLELRTLPNELLTVDILLSIKYYTWKEICGLSSASTRTQNVHSMHGREQRVFTTLVSVVNGLDNSF